jgi:peptidoglycan DL-endopeptidase LytF
MDKIPRYELKKINEHSDEHVLFIYLDDNLFEFGDELDRVPIERKDIIDMAKEIVKNRYPTIKVTMIKVLVGGMTISSIHLFGANMNTAKAAVPIAKVTHVSQSGSIYYQVVSGDTLWNVSKKFNTSTDNIKRANKLSSNSLKNKQRLIIPKAFHTVRKGESLSVISKRFGTPMESLRIANKLTSDSLPVGQMLTIPAVVAPTPKASLSTSKGTIPASVPKQTSTTPIPEPATSALVPDQATRKPVSDQTITTPVPEQATSAIIQDQLTKTQVPEQSTTTSEISKATTTYKVVAGDSLWIIGSRFKVTVNDLKSENGLTSDVLKIGQTLTIPASTITVKETVPDVVPTQTMVFETNLDTIQRNLQTLSYFVVPIMTGNSDTSMTQAIKNFQNDYGLPVTGVVDEATNTAIDHAIVKNSVIKSSLKYTGVPYLWGGTTPSGFDCSGFVYYMFNQHGVNIARTTSGDLYKSGIPIQRSQLQPGDLVFFAVDSPGKISHVGFYMGDNQFISATTSKGIRALSLDNTYWAKYYVGAKRIY